jgi:hypothetical protein
MLPTIEGEQVIGIHRRAMRPRAGPGPIDRPVYQAGVDGVILEVAQKLLEAFSVEEARVITRRLTHGPMRK